MTAHRSLENVSKLKYFGTAATHQNRIQEETKRDQIQGTLVPIQLRTSVFLPPL